MWLEHQSVKVMAMTRGKRTARERPPGPKPALLDIWKPCSTHQAAQDGQEDGDGGWVAHELCDNGHQDACQQGDGPRWEVAQRQHLVPNPRGEARALQEGKVIPHGIVRLQKVRDAGGLSNFLPHFQADWIQRHSWLL